MAYCTSCGSEVEWSLLTGSAGTAAPSLPKCAKHRQMPEAGCGKLPLTELRTASLIREVRQPTLALTKTQWTLRCNGE